jgi:TolB-like protein
LDPIRTVPRVGYRLMVDASRATILELRPSVAVLPFANLSGDPDFAFFADGVTEDIIAALSRFRTFAVVARGSSFGYGSRGVSAVQAAAALGVRYVLEGSVRREGHRLRVAARLSDDAGTVLWADRFEEELGGVFEMQDHITAAVVHLAEPRITRAEIERSRRKQPESLDAYDHFLRGMAYYDLPTRHERVALRRDGPSPRPRGCARPLLSRRLWPAPASRTSCAAASGDGAGRDGRLRHRTRPLRPRRGPG